MYYNFAKSALLSHAHPLILVWTWNAFYMERSHSSIVSHWKNFRRVYFAFCWLLKMTIYLQFNVLNNPLIWKLCDQEPWIWPHSNTHCFEKMCITYEFDSIPFEFDEKKQAYFLKHSFFKDNIFKEFHDLYTRLFEM